MNHTAMNNSIWTTISQSLSDFEFSHFCRYFPFLFDSCGHTVLIIFSFFMKYLYLKTIIFDWPWPVLTQRPWNYIVSADILNLVLVTVLFTLRSSVLSNITISPFHKFLFPSLLLVCSSLQNMVTANLYTQKKIEGNTFNQQNFNNT